VPAIPAKPPVAPPKVPEPVPAAPAGPVPEKPVAPAPVKPQEAKPAAPEKKPQDDPFGTRNDVKSLRMWSDASGKYRIEARFVSCQDDTVRLQKTDGRYYRVKYDRLSTADQDYVQQQDGSLFAAE
jgi:hypothetical protein